MQLEIYSEKVTIHGIKANQNINIIYKSYQILEELIFRS